MANIKKHLDNIRGALYGKDVRSSIHDGIDAINKEVESTTRKQVDLESTFNQLVINAGNSNAEIVDARVKADGTSYAKLGDRLDSVDSQLEHKVNTSHLSINVKSYGAIGDGVNDDSEAFKNALSELKGGGCLFIPYGLYKIKNVEIKYSNVLLKGENSIIYTNSFSIQENVENTTFENLNFVGELNYYKITEVLNNGEKILIENIKTEYHNLTFTPAQHNTEIVQAQLGNDAGITGAAGLIYTYVLEKDGVK